MKKLIVAAALAVAAPLAIAPTAQAAPAPQAAYATTWTKIATYSTYAICVDNGHWWVRNGGARAYKCVNVVGTGKFTLFVTF